MTSRIKQLQEAKKKAEVCYNLGIQFYEKKDYDQALTYYEMSIEQNPKHVGSLNNMGAIHKHRGGTTVINSHTVRQHWQSNRVLL